MLWMYCVVFVDEGGDIATIVPDEDDAPLQRPNDSSSQSINVGIVKEGVFHGFFQNAVIHHLVVDIFLEVTLG